MKDVIITLPLPLAFAIYADLDFRWNHGDGIVETDRQLHELLAASLPERVVRGIASVNQPKAD